MPVAAIKANQHKWLGIIFGHVLREGAENIRDLLSS
jgi:hypothetical protein